MNRIYVIVKIKNHPFLPDGNIFEHRLIMANKIGRKLERNEHVHHKNGNKRDNRLKNLQLLTASEHHRLEMTGKKRGPFTPEWRAAISRSLIGTQRALGCKHSKESIRRQVKSHQESLENQRKISRWIMKRSPKLMGYIDQIYSQLSSPDRRFVRKMRQQLKTSKTPLPHQLIRLHDISQRISES